MARPQPANTAYALMLAFTSTLIPFLLGLWLRGRLTGHHLSRLNRLNYLLLHLLLLGLFARQGWEPQLLPLLFAGVALHALPALIGAWHYRQGGRGEAWLIFSTYGGGNRGVLLLTLSCPTALRDFMVIDLGNFLSLALLLPLLQRWAGIGHDQPARWHERVSPLVIPMVAIAAGLLLRAAALAGEPLVLFSEGVKWVLSVGVALYLGLQFRLTGLSLRRLIADLLRVRLTTLLLVGTLIGSLFTITDLTLEHTTLVALLIFMLLPVSSLLPGMCADQALAERATGAVVGSSVLFLTLLPATLLLGYLCPN